MGSSFNDSFWGEDFTSFLGFETLCKRMKAGKQFMDDYITFTKQRITIEESYAKALIKLGKGAGGQTESGTVRFSMEALKAETAEQGYLHLEYAKQMQDEVEKPCRDFREKQRDVRKKTEDVVKKAQKHKMEKYDKNTKAKKNYESKCREAEKLDEEVTKGHLLQPKDLEKLKSRARKAKLAAEAADMAYQEAVRTLDDARVLWEREMERCCTQFQKLEEQRIEYVRGAMWLKTNVNSKCLVKCDERNEIVRRILENCSAENDILDFVGSKMTGSERPAPIQYENFYTRVDTIPRATTVSTSAVKSPSTSTTSSQPASPTKTYDSKEDLVKAAYDYEAQGDLELTLKTGDIITVLARDDATWWRGSLPNGKSGMFPKAYVLELS